MKIDSSLLSNLLKKVYLGGIVEEAVVDLGLNTVQAVDPTNSVFLNVSIDESEEKIGRIGIGSPTLSMIIKHLDIIKGDIEISKRENRLCISAKGRGEVKYLTVDEEFISTVVLEDNTEEMVEPCVIIADIPAQACSDFNTYMSLVKTKSARFYFDHKTRKVHVESGLESEHQFTIPFGGAEFIDKEHKGSFSVTVYGQHISQIFSALEWSENEKPRLLMAPDHPLIVLQNDTNLWACLPLNEGDI